MRSLEVADPWGLENLKVVERPDPTPGHGQVLVRMKAASLNYRDLLIISGSYARGPMGPGPLVPLSDGCGVVEAVGAGVTRVAVGDRVSTLFFQDWFAGRPTMAKVSTPLGQHIPGAGRELAVFSQEGVSKVPDFLTDHEVATLPCAALTAWRSLFEDARVQPGDTVVLQGTGGVSIFGLQFAAAAGCRTVITSSSDEKLQRAKALGADHTVNYRHTPQWSKAVRGVTDGAGADFIMEVGGAGTLGESLRAVRLGGHIAMIGLVARAGEPLDPTVLIGRAARLQGVLVGSREMFETMCRAIEARRIRPVVDKVYPWTEAREALEAMRAGSHFGKIVLEF
jgi:NADPH:quinone reductase-like Zn-dependent oxidoreductase